MSEPKFESLGIQEASWSLREVSSARVVLKSVGGDEISFLNIALFKFLPAPIGTDARTVYDSAPMGLSLMTGHLDDQRIYGRRQNRQTPQTFVMRTSDGILVVFSEGVHLAESGHERHFP